ncbi:hypothetical protein DDZ14_14590 [Maritimibacter sp. 55A14]|uniref:DUF7742 family protein n=1 Tax=Maritimibacter sp. 55A14 TaxID=2174844 RepID=UPI000D619703|nr:hypothetical protein [Maritimibacter sp. 55A14]PWE30658.1 hypothetical protein DDZ14_14590 [Maritimibacter sp. 55A14]
MRPVLHGDVVTAARALLAAPPLLRGMLAERLVAEACWADIWRKRLRRAHPTWGDGTLEAAARRRALAREPFLNDADYCACMMLVFEALLARRRAGRAISRKRN